MAKSYSFKKCYISHAQDYRCSHETCIRLANSHVSHATNIKSDVSALKRTLLITVHSCMHTFLRLELRTNFKIFHFTSFPIQFYSSIPFYSMVHSMFNVQSSPFRSFDRSTNAFCFLSSRMPFGNSDT